MNKELELLFVKNFIIKPKSERILYEFFSKKKRQNAISRFCHSSLDYIDREKIICETEISKVSEVIDIVKKYTKNDIGYVISWDWDIDGKFLEIDIAITKAMDCGMATIVIIDNIALIKTEQEKGNAKVYILKV